MGVNLTWVEVFDIASFRKWRHDIMMVLMDNNGVLVFRGALVFIL